MAVFMHIRKTKTYKQRHTSSPDDYKKLYRFSEENVEWLGEYFLGESEETRGGALSSKDRMKIFLRYMADPGYQSGIGEEIGVHQTTVSKVIGPVLKKIVEKANTWIHFPQSDNEVRTAQEKWSAKYHFPYAIGAIDCTHVRIPKLQEHGDEYINRKGFASINVQATTCNADEVFTSIDARWPGSVHDSRILKNSDIHKVMNNHTNYCLLLGDDGYPIRTWLMTPWRNTDTQEKRRYNEIFCKERVIIERCFGQLKARFPILQYKVRLSADKIPSVIVGCVMLHNIAKYLKDEDFPWQVDTSSHDDIQGQNGDASSNDALLKRLGDRWETEQMLRFHLARGSNS